MCVGDYSRHVVIGAVWKSEAAVVGRCSEEKASPTPTPIKRWTGNPGGGASGSRTSAPMGMMGVNRGGLKHTVIHSRRCGEERGRVCPALERYRGLTPSRFVSTLTNTASETVRSRRFRSAQRRSRVRSSILAAVAALSAHSTARGGGAGSMARK